MKLASKIVFSIKIRTAISRYILIFMIKEVETHIFKSTIILNHWCPQIIKYYFLK